MSEMHQNLHRVSKLVNHFAVGSDNSAAILVEQANSGSNGPQDLGGVDDFMTIPLNRQTHNYAFWERQLDSLCEICFGRKLLNVHSFRRAIESLDRKVYRETSYYEKWAFSFAVNAIEQNLISNDELQSKIKTIEKHEIKPKFEVGEIVRVREEDNRSEWRKPHLRTPGYIFGQQGVIERYVGAFGNPELHAFSLSGPKQPLYRVRFKQKDVWKGYDDDNAGGDQNDTIDVEIYQHWLQKPEFKEIDQHMPRDELEKSRTDEEHPQTAFQILAEALVELMIEKNFLTKEEIRKNIEEVDMVINNIDLAKSLVIKAWSDPDFKSSLLLDANPTLSSLGYQMHSKIAVLENTSDIHNLVVCTLCSCYPREILGIPPDWYKSSSYRARAVKEPRKVLQEFGLNLQPHVQLRVHDSTADLRYFVIPKRPEGTENWTDSQLKALITRDCLIGVAEPKI